MDEFFYGNVNTVMACLQREWIGTIAIAFGRLAGFRVVLVAMPGTNHPLSIQLSLAQRPVLV